MQGDFEQGWPEYEWRWHVKEVAPRRLPQPLWDGSPLNGQTILLQAEQGLGDAFQFIRYASLVKKRGGTVLATCYQPLASLLRGCPGVDAIVLEDQALPDFDTYAPLLSLPVILKTTLETIPAEVPYLAADAERARPLAP